MMNTGRYMLQNSRKTLYINTTQISNYSKPNSTTASSATVLTSAEQMASVTKIKQRQFLNILFWCKYGED